MIERFLLTAVFLSSSTAIAADMCETLLTHTGLESARGKFQREIGDLLSRWPRVDASLLWPTDVGISLDEHVSARGESHYRLPNLNTTTGFEVRLRFTDERRTWMSSQFSLIATELSGQEKIYILENEEGRLLAEPESMEKQLLAVYIGLSAAPYARVFRLTFSIDRDRLMKEDERGEAAKIFNKITLFKKDGLSDINILKALKLPWMTYLKEHAPRLKLISAQIALTQPPDFHGFPSFLEGDKYSILLDFAPPQPDSAMIEQIFSRPR